MEAARQANPLARSAPPERLPRAVSLPSLHDQDPHVRPYQNGGPFSALREPSTTPTQRYLKECRTRGLVPVSMPYTTGHSNKLNARGRSLGDTDLSALSVMIRNGGIEELNLEGNVLLTDDALASFVGLLFGEPTSTTLKSLNLSRCVRGVRGMADAVISLLSDRCGARNLRSLDLSGVPMATKCHLPLCKAIRDHVYLRQVRLADTGMGDNNSSKLCVGELLTSACVEVLDIGWNCFDANEMVHWADRLVQQKRLKSLSISNCSAAMMSGGISPVIYFVERLASGHELERLDLSMNRIDFRGALVIEDALDKSHTLRVLDISENPLGVLGMRSLLRLLTRDTTNLTSLRSEHCSAGEDPGEDERYQMFNVTHPGGHYTFDLTRPYHRSLLRMLYKACEEHFRIAYDVAFTSISFSMPPYNHPQKDANGIFVVPTNGRLTLTFKCESLMDAVQKGNDMWDYTSFLERYLETTRLQIGPNKAVAFFTQWRSMVNCSLERLVMVDALSKDFVFPYHHLEQLCESREHARGIIMRLLPCIAGGQPARYLSMLLVPTVGDYVKLQTDVKTFLAFNVENPTGRYRFDLENPVHYAVAERLRLLDSWESLISRRLHRVDISQRGNFSQVRNEVYQHQPLRTQSMADWNVPEYGVLELDYVCSKRPPDDAPAVDDSAFNNLMLALQHTKSQPPELVEVLQTISHQLYITSLQLRTLIGLFSDREVCVDLVVALFLRVVDVQNDKVFSVRFHSQGNMARLRTRLGHVVTFPFIQPEQSHFELDLAVHDQRIAGSLLVQLAFKESVKNLCDTSYTPPDGTPDPLPQGVPRSWESLDKMPTNGTFALSYYCSPEDRNLQTRCQLLGTHGFRQMSAEGAVSWWGSPYEAPENVLELLEYLVRQYPDLQAAFKAIRGDEGSDEISQQQFEQGLKAIGCQKFAGDNESHCIRTVFSYLDPNSDDQVSEKEWGMLELLWNELKLSIQEFVQYCMRMFGENLKNAWEVLDADGSGEITKQEWTGVLNKIRYFGAIEPVFNYLDVDDEGTVSWKEFQVLEAFRQSETNQQQLFNP